MESQSEVVLKAFLSLCSAEKQQRLVRFLPESQREHLEKAPVIASAADPKVWQECFHAVHWSWLLAPLKTYTSQEQKYFLASLPLHLSEPLSQSLEQAPPFPKLREKAASYFRSILEKSLLADQEHFLPAPCLEANPLSDLLKLSKKELTHLINLLALQDLAAEIRQVVDTKVLKKIYSFLTEEEKKRLKTISSHPESLHLGKLSLDRWDGTEEPLRLLLHKRGLARLGVALSRQKPPFVWHLCHQLDIGRGSNLHKFSKKEISEEYADVLIREIKELIRDYL